MKKYIATYTTDGGASIQTAVTSAPDYTKAYLNIIREFLHLDIIIIDLTEA